MQLQFKPCSVGIAGGQPATRGLETMTTEIRSRTFILYGTQACHLCELAEDMLETQCRARQDFAIEKVDIAGSDPLFARYGVRIPVLQHPDGRELGWPFTVDQLSEFLAP